MRKFLLAGLLLFGLAALGTPTLFAAHGDATTTLMADGNEYDTGGG